MRVADRIPEVLKNKNFVLYWSGVVFSQIGNYGTTTANLYHVYGLTGSTAQVGLVGLFQAFALLVLSPLGGALADRVNRRRLIQLTQMFSLLVSLALALLTYAQLIQAWHIFIAVMLNTAASTFGNPARNALIPALVPRSQLVQAFALVNPSRELAVLVGPAIGGLLIAIGGPGLMYLLDALTYAALVVILAMLRVPPVELKLKGTSIWRSILEGAKFLRQRPVVLQMMALDLSASIFAAYRVILPALSVEVLSVGPAGYGLLSSAPAAGALLGTVAVFKLINIRPAGEIVLAATAGYGFAAILLAQSPFFALALLAAISLGAMDALGTSVRQAAVQIETPDDMRGRVTSLYGMASRGGPSLGDANIGWIAAFTGPVVALSVGGMIPILHSLMLAARTSTLRGYRVPR